MKGVPFKVMPGNHLQVIAEAADGRQVELTVKLAVTEVVDLESETPDGFPNLELVNVKFHVTKRFVGEASGGASDGGVKIPTSLN